MTYEDVKRIRNNPTKTDVDNEELARLIDLAIEKQIAKKPVVRYSDKDFELPLLCCPSCKSEIEVEPVNHNKITFCLHCGKAIDWSEVMEVSE